MTTGGAVSKTSLRASIIAGALLLVSGGAHAAGLGKLTVQTHLGEPLDSVIFRADSTLPPAERIRAGIGEHLRTYQQEAQFLRVIEEYSGYDEKFAGRRFDQRRSSMQSVIASIEQLQRRGLADPDLDARVTIPALCEMINGLANAWLVRQRLALSLDHAVDQLATLWANTLGRLALNGVAAEGLLG